MIFFKDIDETSAKPGRPAKIVGDSKANAELTPPEDKIEAEQAPATKALRPRKSPKGKAVQK